MKRQIKIVPLILSVFGFFCMGMALAGLHEVATKTELIIGIVFGFFSMSFILLLAIEFPFTKEEREHTEITL
jgi:hypothetical protein